MRSEKRIQSVIDILEEMRVAAHAILDIEEMQADTVEAQLLMVSAHAALGQLTIAQNWTDKVGEHSELPIPEATTSQKALLDKFKEAAVMHRVFGLSDDMAVFEETTRHLLAITSINAYAQEISGVMQFALNGPR